MPTSGAEAEWAPSTVPSVLAPKSTIGQTAILSKQVSLPSSMDGTGQGGHAELLPTATHTLAAVMVVTEVQGPWASTAPAGPTSHPLSGISPRTASRESSMALLPQLSEAHGPSAGPQVPAEPGGEATTEQSVRSAPVQSIPEDSAWATQEANISAACVVSNQSGF